ARPHEAAASMAMVQEFVHNQGSAWQVTMGELSRYSERAATKPSPQWSPDEASAWIRSDAPFPENVVEDIGAYLSTAEVIGRRTGAPQMSLAWAAADPAAP